MIIKDKRKETTVRVEKLEAEGRHYEYRLSVSDSTQVASYKLPLYSIAVEMTDEQGIKSSATLTEVFSEADRAFRFFTRLVDNLATPIDLSYVYEDECLR